MEEAIHSFLAQSIIPIENTDKKSSKIIHDTLWGTQRLFDYEVELLDQPFLQRLRKIGQTAYTYLIYPSTTHTRFEHSLGVLYQTEQLIRNLKSKPELRELEFDEKNLRAAALLHDIGHGPLSHTSEDIYKTLPDIQEYIGTGKEYESGTAHEVIACKIIKSAPFREFIGKLNRKYAITLNSDKIANYIVGIATSPDTRYITDIINGPFDADKLDYIFRDGHFSGLPLTVDLDRLWYSCDVRYVPGVENNRTLMVNLNGTTPLEQILFSKMVLYSNVYQHHKVRTCDCMFKALVLYCWDKEVRVCGRDLKKASDFLFLTDPDILTPANYDPLDDTVKMFISQLRNRSLWKRALTLCLASIDDVPEANYEYGGLTPEMRELKSGDIRSQHRIAEEICEAAGSPCSKYELWFDMPKFPPTGMADETFVVNANEEPIQLSELFKVDNWAHDYVINKYRCHLFCADDPELRRKLADAGTNLLSEKYGLQVNQRGKDISKLK